MLFENIPDTVNALDLPTVKRELEIAPPPLLPPPPPHETKTSPLP
jgi:hypothetical protein